MKNILAIIGSASAHSANLRIVQKLVEISAGKLHITIFDKLATLPHFNAEQSMADTPQEILNIRQKIDAADGIVICTPEYVFSIPSGLKNLIEWCVATTVFSGKPTGLITASSSGSKAHEELILIMKTIDAKFTAETTLLIPGVKSKVPSSGEIMDLALLTSLKNFLENFTDMLS